jgi:exopolyphosphatase/guanosine-5'-triphosphate,3'-diphosphate pyrophosphatase
MIYANGSPHTVAFMDFGTNSIRLLVVRIDPNQSFTILHKLKETVRLGEGEFERNRLQPQAIERAITVATQFAHVAEAAGADEIVAVATAATREAENNETFLHHLKDRAGIDVRIVSGLEEARLIYLGVATGADIGERQALFIDIGGGSTESIIGTQNDHLYLSSEKLGAIRLSAQFLGDDDGPVSSKRYNAIRDYVRTHAARTLHELSMFRIDAAYGSSGTIESLAEVGGDPSTLTYKGLQESVRMLCSLPLSKRRDVPGLTPSRADIVVGGAAIIETYMQELGIDRLAVSDRGLRDGLLVDYLLRHGKADLFGADVGLRERSVLQLGRACRFNEEHARTTARLALQLFDSAAASGLHKMGTWERELLEYAALLHHIGGFLTYNGYQRHGHYLVRNAELLGFDQLEIAMMAEMVLYHRGSLPRLAHHEFAMLEHDQQDAVRMLSTFLRVAENLDRSQTNHITAARLGVEKPGRLALELQATRDPQVEISGLDNQRGAIERVFGRKLVVRTWPEGAAQSIA